MQRPPGVTQVLPPAKSTSIAGSSPDRLQSHVFEKLDPLSHLAEDGAELGVGHGEVDATEVARGVERAAAGWRRNARHATVSAGPCVHVKPRKRSVTRVRSGLSQSSDAAHRSVSRRSSALTTDGHCRNDSICAARSCSAASGFGSPVKAPSSRRLNKPTSALECTPADASCEHLSRRPTASNGICRIHLAPPCHGRRLADGAGQSIDLAQAVGRRRPHQRVAVGAGASMSDQDDDAWHGPPIEDDGRASYRLGQDDGVDPSQAGGLGAAAHLTRNLGVPRCPTRSTRTCRCR